MHVIQQLIAERVASGLKRKSVTSCSRWASMYRVMGSPFPGPWTFKYHPWLKEMHDSNTDMNVGQKAAQMGYTEWALNTAFHAIDVKGISVLYVLPAKTPDATDFSAARFDPALEMSLHLSKLFSDVKNIGHKRAGTNNLYIRGSKSRSSLKSIPVGLLILDEVDEMLQKNVTLALERTAGQVQRQNLLLSTPTIFDHGINLYYNISTQEHFMFKCPKCNKSTEFVFPDCLVVTGESLTDINLENSYIQCKECKNKLCDKDDYKYKHTFLSTGRFVPTHKQRSIRGFHVNQLYSSALAGNPVELGSKYLKSLTNPADEQEFWNSSLGLPHVPEGAAIDDTHLDECRNINPYRNGKIKPHGLITMGVDVGKWLHVQIDRWTLPETRYSSDCNIEATPKCLFFTKVKTFDELDRLMFEWKVNFCVMDVQPERRPAYDFACRFPGFVKLCFYARGISGKQMHAMKDKSEDYMDEHTINVDRTSWLDLRLGRYRRKAILIPMDLSEEYRINLKALVRLTELDKDGNPIAIYRKADNTPDHYAHASTYSEIALPFAIGLGAPKSINVR